MNQAYLTLNLGLVLVFCLVGASLISSSVIYIGDVQASTEGEDGSAEEQEGDESQEEGSSEDEGGEQEQGDQGESDTNDIDPQEVGSENNELDESSMAAQQSGACPAVAIGGPTYEDENGCPVPCPKSGEVDGIPEGCPLPTDETTTSDVPDTVPTTQTPSIPNSENTGVGPPTQTYTFDDFFTPRSSKLSTTPDGSKVAPTQSPNQPTPPYKTYPPPSFSSELPTTPDSVQQWWNTLFSKYYHPLNVSQSSQVPDVVPTDSSISDIPAIAPTQTPSTPSSENTEVEQPTQTDKTGNLLGPYSSELSRTPDSVLTQKPPDTVFSGPKTMPGGDVPLSNPDLVRAPAEEGKGPSDCIVISGCNFPYPISDDEICRNGIDDDLDGKVDEAYPCSEVPGQSKPKPKTDDVLVPIPSDGLVPK